jgi:uncharacterized protein with von Willebrand factor type A (vWA) domain
VSQVSTPTPALEADELLVGFTRALRAAGVAVSQDRTMGFLRAAAVVGLGDRQATYWAGRATLCAGPEDLGVYDEVFSGWFLDPSPPRHREPRAQATVSHAALDADGAGGGAGGDDEEDDLRLRVAASDTERLRHRDIAALTPVERAALARLFGTLSPRLPRRSAYRAGPASRGAVDQRRTLRRTLARMGEPDLAWRRRTTRPRRVVLLVDVSGSMSAYADALLRLAHRVVSASPEHGAGAVEVFTVGTRITRVTRALRLRDAEQAIVAAGRTVPDWSGGTRLGETLQAFLDRWGQRGMARGAVVVVFSDGWELGDARLLGDQMQRLSRLAHRVVWANPHRGSAGYQPVQQGMAAALPHVDTFVAGHSLAAFAELMEAVADA